MVVDEDGLNKRLPHNCVGTHFYDPHMKHSVGIVGDIIIMCEGMTDEGPDFVDMPQDMAKETLEIMTVMYIAERYKDEVLVFHKPDGWKFATKNQELGAKIVKMIEAIKTPDETVTHETVKGSRVMTELLEAKESARRVSKSLN
jgi:hypothetical protein